MWSGHETMLQLLELTRCARSIYTDREMLSACDVKRYGKLISASASGCSVADRSQPKPHGGSNSEETTNDGIAIQTR